MTLVSETGKRLICEEVGRDPNEWDIYLHLTGWEDGAPCYEIVWHKRQHQLEAST